MKYPKAFALSTSTLAFVAALITLSGCSGSSGGTSNAGLIPSASTPAAGSMLNHQHETHPQAIGNATPLFFANFEDTQNALSAWSPYDGQWSLLKPPSNSQEYGIAANTGEAASFAGDSTWTDYVVQSYVRFTNDIPNGSIAIIGRSVDPKNFYQLELRTDNGVKKWMLYKQVNGAWIRLSDGTFNYQQNTYYILRLSMQGKNLSVSLSSDFGQSFLPLGSTQDDAFTHGRLGLRLSNGAIGSFDVVTATSLASALPPASSLPLPGTPSGAANPQPPPSTTPNQPTGIAPVSTPMQYFHPERSLHVQGADILDPTGKKMKLHGINLGGWLGSFGDMFGQHAVDSGQNIEGTLEKRFGVAQASQLMNTWYDLFIQEHDLDFIHTNMGFNMLRVPFSWRTLENADGSFRRTASGEIDFTRMDWIVAQAQKRNMYVIFDLHNWQGQDGTTPGYQRISQWGDTPDREEASALWNAVAAHYVGNGTIAAFDVINEPNGSPGDTLQSHLTAAIRAGDPNRVVAVESVTPQYMAQNGMTNAIYSTHWYPGNPAAEQQAFIASSFQQSITQPIWIGEWQSPDPALAGAEAAGWNAAGYNWSPWTYKATNYGGWATMDYYSGFSVNIDTDSYETILAAYQKWLPWSLAPTQNVPNYYLNQSMIDGYKAANSGL